MATESPGSRSPSFDRKGTSGEGLRVALDQLLVSPGLVQQATKVSPALHEAARAATSGQLASMEQDLRFEWRDSGTALLVDIAYETDFESLEADLLALGAHDISVFGRLVSAVVPADAIGELEALDSVRFARPVAQPLQHVGSVTSQTDVAVAADLARAGLSVDGTGVKVGVLSDSFDCFGDADTDVGTNDLPANVTVVQERTGCVGALDEGRAMMQIIHDVAPGAELLFHSAINGGQSGFANAILELESLGADVIVDDITFLSEPMFQDGVVAQAIDTVTAAGAVYMASAGNVGRDSYEAPFENSGFTIFGLGVAHDFDPGPDTDLFHNITVPAGATLSVVLQWDDPFFTVSGAPGADSNLDIFLTDEPPTVGLAASQNANVGGDPVEILTFTNSSGLSESFNIVIEGISGPVPGLIKYVIGRGGTVEEFATNSSSIYGHANSAGAMTVGAAAYFDTPAFGVSPPVLESFSSAGGTPILFATNGASINEDRAKPDFVAPDGGNTTFFGTDAEPDGFPNFFGTSASVANAAGVGALMLDRTRGLAPDQVRAALLASAIDMGEPGFDSDSGAGLIQADQAVLDATRPPHVIEVRASVADGAYKAGDVIDIDVVFNDAVELDTGAGTPSLQLETGPSDRTAEFQSHSENVFSFRYTVLPGDTTAALDYVSSGALAMNGALAASESTGLDAEVALPNPGDAGSISGSQSIEIDTAAPAVVSVEVPADDLYVVDETLTFLVNTSEAVAVSGGTTLVLDLGGLRQAALVSGSGTSSLTFEYTIVDGDSDLDGISLTALSGAIADAAGNALLPTLNGVGDTSGIVVDARAPSVQNVLVPEDATYIAGQTMSFTVNLDETVSVLDGPGLDLNIGGTPRRAAFIGGGGSSTLQFEYTVQAGEQDADGIVVRSLTGTFSDGAGNMLDLTLRSIEDTSGVRVDAVAPTVVSVTSSSPNGTYREGDTIEIDVVFSEAITTTGPVELVLETGRTDTTLQDDGTGSGSNTLHFVYTVGTDHETPDLDYVSSGALTGTVADAAGNSAVLTLPVPGSAGSLGGNKDLSVEIPLIPTAGLVIDNDTISEEGGTVTITATLSAVPEEAVIVALDYAGTATLGEDFEVGANDAIRIPAGAMTASVTVTLTAIDDAEVDPDETIIVSIADVTGGLRGTPSEQTITIEDDDILPPSGGGPTPPSSTGGCSVSTDGNGAGSMAFLLLVAAVVGRRRRRR